MQRYGVNAELGHTELELGHTPAAKHVLGRGLGCNYEAAKKHSTQSKHQLKPNAQRCASGSAGAPHSARPPPGTVPSSNW